jgi:hypothetical protein
LYALIQSLIIPLSAVIAAVATWLAANFIGKPVLEVRKARLEAIEAAERYAFVSSSAGWECANAASQALGDISSKLRSLSRGQDLPGRLYCRLMSYDLEMAAKAINGLQHMAGENISEQTRKNNLNLVYSSLNAYQHISNYDILILKKALDENQDSK